MGGSRERVWWMASCALLLAWLALTAPLRPAPLGMDAEIYRSAARAAAAGHSIYAIPGYLYPPLLAWLLVPLAALDAATFAVLWQLTLALGAISIPVLTIAMAQLQGRAAALLVLALLFSPTILDAVPLGNVQFLITALVLAAGALLARAPKTAGLLIGLATAIKITPGLLLVYLFSAGRQRTPLLHAAILGSFVAALSLLLPGFSEFAKGTAHGAFAAYKQHAGSNFSWSTYFHYLGLTLPSAIPALGAAAAAAYLGTRKGPLQLHWAILLALLLIGSPINWAHSYTLAFLPSALLLPRLERWLADKPRGALAAHALWTLPWAVLARCEAFFEVGSVLGRSVFPLVPLSLPVVLVVVLWPRGEG